MFKKIWTGWEIIKVKTMPLSDDVEMDHTLYSNVWTVQKRTHIETNKAEFHEKWLGLYKNDEIPTLEELTI